MSFVSDISSGDNVKFDVLGNSLEGIARVAIGHDMAAGQQYSIVVQLVRLEPYYGDYNSELMFTIVGKDIREHSTRPPCFFEDGLMTKEFLEGDHRKTALDLICCATQLLLCERRPETVTFSTYLPNLPKPALRKYGRICDVLRGVGYQGGQADSYEGSQIWMFTKDEHTE